MTKSKLFIAMAILVSTLFCQAQQTGNREKWQWLTGEWKGDGNGQPGQGTGSFTFATDLDSHIIVRKSHTEFPATSSRKAFVHDDLLIVDAETPGDPVSAIYFDNEGHTLRYTIAYSDKSITLTSEKVTGMPVFRLIYTQTGENNVGVSFEISKDGTHFMPYMQGKSTRVVK
jgi:hypothetical protein